MAFVLSGKGAQALDQGVTGLQVVLLGDSRPWEDATPARTVERSIGVLTLEGPPSFRADVAIDHTSMSIPVPPGVNVVDYDIADPHVIQVTQLFANASTLPLQQDLTFSPDGTYDIGNVTLQQETSPGNLGSNRPRALYLQGRLFVGGNQRLYGVLIIGDPNNPAGRPSGTGTIMLKSGDAIRFRNGTNTGDITGMRVTSLNEIQIGQQEDATYGFAPSTWSFGGLNSGSRMLFFPDAVHDIGQSNAKPRTIWIANPPTNPLHATNKAYVDQLADRVAALEARLAAAGIP